jgi:methylglutaconyl-CoA hydratase
MQDVLNELLDQVLYITLNRVEKHNAFDDTLLCKLQEILDDAEKNEQVRIIVLQANGPHFSAGADLAWMQRMADMTETENLADAQILARVMYTLHHSEKPTLALVQGGAFGGGAGLAAACDIVLAAHSARFCFSEVKLGLIPAVISPYIIRAIGERATTWLFMSAETFNAETAAQLQLVQHVIPDDIFLSTAQSYIKKISKLPPEALKLSKALVKRVSNRPMDEALQSLTASMIAEKRVSTEGQRGIKAFLNKETIDWN